MRLQEIPRNDGAADCAPCGDIQRRYVVGWTSESTRDTSEAAPCWAILLCFESTARACMGCSSRIHRQDRYSCKFRFVLDELSEKRDELEELSWAVVQEVIKFAKAQEDRELRLFAMGVVGYLIRTGLAIQHEQDQAAVDELFAQLEATRDELVKKVKAGDQGRSVGC